MKRNSIFIFSLVLTIISCTPHDITSSYVPVTNRTAEVHAYECEDALGPLPRFSCADAVEVPTTKDGVPRIFLISNNWSMSMFLTKDVVHL